MREQDIQRFITETTGSQVINWDAIGVMIYMVLNQPDEGFAVTDFEPIGVTYPGMLGRILRELESAGYVQQIRNGRYFVTDKFYAGER